MNLIAKGINILAAVALLSGFIQNVEAEEIIKNKEGIIFFGSETKWQDAPNYPGAKMVVVEGNPKETGPFTIRYKFPANTAIPPHFHPGEERDTVISGSLHVVMRQDLSSQVPQTLLSGDFWFIPAEFPHAAFTTEETVLQIQGMGPWGITYISCPVCF